MAQAPIARIISPMPRMRVTLRAAGRDEGAGGPSIHSPMAAGERPGPRACREARSAAPNTCRTGNVSGNT